MKLNVIVIDDSPIQLLIASKLIQKNECLTLLGSYTNPTLGLAAVNSMDVDIVLLDVEMPKMDGFSFKKGINKEVPVIMNSTRSSFKSEALRSGVMDFLCKPLNATKLGSAVSKIIAVCSHKSYPPNVFPAIAS